MRIDGNSRARAVGYGGAAGRTGQAAAFVPDEGQPIAHAANGPAVAAMGGIDALLALQAADDPLAARKKAIRRGGALLDLLEEIKADLLTGRVGEGRLNQLLALIGQARERTIPGLDSVLGDIELRARVELAKFGRFTSD